MAVRSDTLPDVGDLERFRREITAYSYRMLGSAFEADDAAQETMLRAWRSLDGFEGRSEVRSWLYRIATNVCLDMLRGRQRRARPMELGGSSPADPQFLGETLPEHAWVTPVPDARVLPDQGDPALVAESKETVRLAFVTALQHLPAKQRAVLILRDVLKWQASEVAQLLETSVASVNSALQRARATVAEKEFRVTDARTVPADRVDRELVAQYVDAFERYDVDRLVTLLHEDAVQSMPPYAMWLEGRDQIAQWFLGAGIGCKGSRLVPAAANGRVAFGQYRVDPEGGHTPWALQVLEVADGRIVEFHAFLDTATLFPIFGLPLHLD